MKKIVLLAAVMIACGGKKQSDTTPESNMADTTPPPHDSSGDMVDPQKMEEVRHDLDRKQMIVSHCLATAMEAGEVKKGTHGRVTLEIAISASGHADNVKIIRTDIEAKSVTDCVIKHVEDIAFPEMNKQYETSYTYAMEAN